MRRREGTLLLGTPVVELLIPHRRPFLLVDHVRDFAPVSPASVRAGRHLSTGEAVLEGHFPGFPIWPGVYTLEGLGQTGAILLTLVELTERARHEGLEPGHVLEGLRNLDRGYRLHPGYREADAEAFLAWLPTHPPLALGAAVDMKFLRPVFPGSRLDYEVELDQRVGDSVRFRAEAFVDDRAVARGTITGSLSRRPLPPRL